MNNKILKSEKNLLKIKKIKSSGKKIGLCHGVFDLLHIGHINHFLEAKKHCDILVVSLTKDEFMNGDISTSHSPSVKDTTPPISLISSQNLVENSFLVFA